MEMTIDYSELITIDLLQEVYDEVTLIQRELHDDVLKKVGEGEIDANSTSNCIYGKLFHSAMSEESYAFKLNNGIQERYRSLVVVKDLFDLLPRDLSIYKKVEYNGFFSALEFYISIPGAKVQAIVDFLTSKTNDLNLTDN